MPDTKRARVDVGAGPVIKYEMDMNGKMAGTDLLSFITRLNERVIKLLFKKPTSCLAAFSMLTPMAKQFVFRLLFVDEPVDRKVIDGWASSSGLSASLVAIKWLKQLQIFQVDLSTKKISLQQDFQRGFRTIVAGGGRSFVDRASLKDEKKIKSREKLKEHADSKWEALLSAMVGGTKEEVDDEVIQTVFEADLLSGTPAAHSVTKTGFQFLLQERREQLWYYLFNLMESFSDEEELSETLSFIFELGFAQLGDDLPLSTLTEHQRNIVPHLYELGIIYYSKRKPSASIRYYPTPSAVSLMQPREGVNGHSLSKGYLIVETNFRVYAYDATSLQNDLLALFIDIRYKLPGVTVGVITRDSVRKAYIHGIKAQQLAYFLRIHAHPRMAPNATDFSPIPETVVHQLFLWEWERARVVFHDAKLYTFTSRDIFECIAQFAKDHKILLWSKPRVLKMAVTSTGHMQVKKFRREQQGRHDIVNYDNK